MWPCRALARHIPESPKPQLQRIHSVRDTPFVVRRSSRRRRHRPASHPCRGRALRSSDARRYPGPGRGADLPRPLPCARSSRARGHRRGEQRHPDRPHRRHAAERRHASRALHRARRPGDERGQRDDHRRDDPGVPVRGPDRRRARTPDQRRGRFGIPDRAALLDARAIRRARLARHLPARHLRAVRERDLPARHRWRVGHEHRVARGAERDRALRGAGIVHRGQRRVGKFRVGHPSLALLTEYDRAKPRASQRPVRERALSARV